MQLLGLIGRGRLVAALVSLFCFSLVASAGAETFKSAGKLSARLTLAARPGAADLSPTSLAQRLGLPESGPGALNLDNRGRLLVYVFMTDYSAEGLAALKRAGAELVHLAPDHKIVTARIAPVGLADLARVGAVGGIREAVRPVVRGTKAPDACTGSTVSEGDAVMKADQARATYGVDGAGVTVGVISDSFASITEPTSEADDVRTGDLPGPGNPCGRETPVNVIKDVATETGSDEGRAMAQIVHDLAPGADLAFATAWDGMFDFADQIRALKVLAGADVIVDDIGYPEEPFFQDGPLSAAIKNVTDQGGLYFTALGNDNAVDASGNRIASYEAPAYRPCDCPKIYDEAGQEIALTGDCHDFDPGTGVDPTMTVQLKPGADLPVDLQWAEPWYGVQTDLDVYIVDSENKVLARSTDSQLDSAAAPWPYELASFTNRSGLESVRIIIVRAAGAAAPRLKYIFAFGWGMTATEYNASNSTDIFGPAGYGHTLAREAFSLGAAPYYAPDRPTYYSTPGPGVRYFGPVVGSTPASPLAAPEYRYKPDATAIHGGANTFFGQLTEGVWRFWGTSAAAPHAAAVAALALDRANRLGITLTQPMIETILESTAAPMTGGSDWVGAGLIDALAALGQLTADSATGLFVKRFYEHCLLRRPDADGLTYWTTRLEAGQATGADLARAFFLGPETTARELSDAEFTRLAFRTLWAMDASTDDVNPWLELLARGMTRAEMIAEFLIDQRFAVVCAEYGVKPN